MNCLPSKRSSHRIWNNMEKLNKPSRVKNMLRDSQLSSKEYRCIKHLAAPHFVSPFGPNTLELMGWFKEEISIWTAISLLLLFNKMNDI